jgi:hypothetical protein
MSITIWISLLTLFVGTAVTLAVAYMSRKQMRQIELHRADPTVPLVPPLHPYTRFIRRYGYYIAAATYDAIMLERDLGGTKPLTRGIVAEISLDVTGITVMILLAFVVAMLHSIVDTIGRTAYDAAADVNGAIKALVKTTDIVVGMDTRIKNLEDQRKKP